MGWPPPSALAWLATAARPLVPWGLDLDPSSSSHLDLGPPTASTLSPLASSVCTDRQQTDLRIGGERKVARTKERVAIGILDMLSPVQAAATAALCGPLKHGPAGSIHHHDAAAGRGEELAGSSCLRWLAGWLAG